MSGIWSLPSDIPQDAQKVVQQGRRRVETAEEVYSLGYVEDFDEPRAIHGNRRVSVRLG